MMTRKPETYAKAAEVVRAAQERMNDGGKHWIKGSFRRKLADESYGYCILGGVRAESKSSTKAAQEAAEEAILREIQGSGWGTEDRDWFTDRNVIRPFRHIPEFNDHPETNWKHVKAVLSRAAENLEKQGKK